MSVKLSRSTALLSAIVFVTIAAQLAGAVETCPSFDSTHDVYNLKTLPYDCATPYLHDCSSGLCLCLGAKQYDTEAQQCTGGASISEAVCDDVSFCTRVYALCVVAAFNNTNATCAGSWYTFIDEQVREQLLNPELVNESALFDSCRGYLCEFTNATWPTCTLDYDFTCHAAFAPANGGGNAPTLEPLPPGGDVPVPTTVNGQPSVPVTRISADVTFAGDFKGVFQKGQVAVGNLQVSVGVSFTQKFNRPFSCSKVSLGSLVATVSTDVPQGQTGAINAVINNIKALNSDTSTGWLSAISDACAAAGACSTGVGAPTVKLSSITTTNVAAQSNPPVQQTCGSGCVAGIIIACVAAAVIITAVTCVIVKRSSSAGTGTKANEPTQSEEMKSDPQVV